MNGGRPWAASVTARIMFGTFTVALIAVVVTGVVALQVVQGVVESQARQQLKAQATALVAARATGSHVAAARLAALGDRFAVVAPDGAVTGAARSSVSAAVVPVTRCRRRMRTVKSPVGVTSSWSRNRQVSAARAARAPRPAGGPVGNSGSARARRHPESS